MWKEIPRKRYYTLLEMAVCIHRDINGFLLAERKDLYTCDICGATMPRYQAFAQRGRRYYASVKPMSIPEYRRYLAELLRK